jgi:uncharacterized protein (TIGR02300 family)
MAKVAAQRGTKRTCQSCGARFYDLNRDHITCPICSAVYVDDSEEVAAVAAPAAERPARRPRVVEPEVVEPAVEAELPEDVVADDDALANADPVAQQDDTFLEEEDEDTDVAGFIDGGIEEGGEDET